MPIDYGQVFNSGTPAPTAPQASGIDYGQIFGNAPQTQQPAPVSQPQTQPVAETPQTPLQKVGSYAGAALGGFANFGADVGRAGADLPAYLLHAAGAISTNTANNWYQATQQAANDFRPDGTSIQNSVDQHPWVAKGIEYAGDMLTLSKAMGGVSDVLASPTAKSVLQAIPGTSLPMRALVNSVTGGVLGATSTAGDQGNKDTSAKWGAALGGIPTVLGTPIQAGANYLTRNSQMLQKIQQVVGAATASFGGQTSKEAAGQSVANMYNASKTANDANYNVIKSIDADVGAGTVIPKINSLLKDYESELTPQQAGTLRGLRTSAVNVETPAQLLELNQDINKAHSVFAGTNASQYLYDAFQDVGKTGRGLLQDIADANGVGDSIKTANHFYENTMIPLKQMNADGIAQSIADTAAATAQDAKNVAQGIQAPPTPYNQVEYAKNINGIYNSVLKDPLKAKALLSNMDDSGRTVLVNHSIQSTLQPLIESAGTPNYTAQLTRLNAIKNTLSQAGMSEDELAPINGVQKILKEAQQITPSSDLATKIASKVTGSVGLGGAGAIGGYEGYKEGGFSGAITGAIALPLILRGMGNLINSSQGQAILQDIGKSNSNSSKVMDFIKSIGIMGLGSMHDNKAAVPEYKPSAKIGPTALNDNPQSLKNIHTGSQPQQPVQTEQPPVQTAPTYPPALFS